MFTSIKIAIVAVILATGSIGYFYVQKLQSDLQTARDNVAKMEVAVATAEASIETLQNSAAQMQALNQTLQSDLQKAEAYGDDLRGKLQRHNLTAMALAKPGLLEGKMNGATANLWRDLEQDTGGAGDRRLPSWLRSSDTGTGDTSGNGNTEDDSTDSSSTEADQPN